MVLRISTAILHCFQRDVRQPFGLHSTVLTGLHTGALPTACPSKSFTFSVSGFHISPNWDLPLVISDVFQKMVKHNLDTPSKTYSILNNQMLTQSLMG